MELSRLNQELQELHDELVVAVSAAATKSSGLAWVPTVVDRLVRLGRTRAQAKDAVLEAARHERIELRPESGLGRVSAEEMARMPTRSMPGSGRVYYSWIRVLLVLTVTGCAPKPPGSCVPAESVVCLTDDECPVGAVCRAGKCEIP